MGELRQHVLRNMVVKSEEQRLVYGEVYSPLHVDTDMETMTAEDIQAAAHSFLASGRVNKIDVGHDGVESGCLVVESFIARKQDPDGFIEGAWVLGVLVAPQYWDQVKSGELNGFSFAGSVEKVPVTAKVVVARKMMGRTEMSSKGLLPPHDHPVEIDFSESGRVLSGVTGKTLDHVHTVGKATATDRAMDHSHRLILIENE